VTRPGIAFLDRDGTIIRDVKYISDPDAVELLDGASAAIARLNEAGVPVVVVTNQSGIGRGYYDVEDYERVHARMLDVLAETVLT
jgi:D-glycero-D-manno-heptose 1,7-bisphosphate phosphatase